MEINLPNHLIQKHDWLRSIYPHGMFIEEVLDWAELLFPGKTLHLAEPNETTDWEGAHYEYWAIIQEMYDYERAISVKYDY